MHQPMRSTTSASPEVPPTLSTAGMSCLKKQRLTLPETSIVQGKDCENPSWRRRKPLNPRWEPRALSDTPQLASSVKRRGTGLLSVGQIDQPRRQPWGPPKSLPSHCHKPVKLPWKEWRSQSSPHPSRMVTELQTAHQGAQGTVILILMTTSW